MKGTRFFIYWLVSLILGLVISLPAFAENTISKGSAINLYNPDLLDAWTASYHERPISVGTPIRDGIIEYHPATLPPCNWSMFGLPSGIGQFTSVPQASDSTATVVEKRFVQSGTVSVPGSPDSTIVASTVEYYIQSGPSPAVGVTLRRSDWESGGRTGTTFSYFRNDPNLGTPYFHGHCEGDINGVFRYIGTDSQGHSITETRRTRVDDVQDTTVSTIIWDNPILSVIESEEVHTGVQIFTMDGIESIVAGSSTCFPDTGNVDLHYGVSFDLPAFNVGHYRDSYHGTISPDYGYWFNYHYTTTPGTEVAPRVIGLTQAGAQDLIADMGFTVGSITWQPSIIIPKGRVISQSVNAGSLIPFLTPINLVVSDGTPNCECDLNSDGRCDMRDWLLFGQRWGATNCSTVPCACDMNADGRCDLRDWLLFGNNWGRTDCTAITFNKVYGGSSYDAADAVHRTRDGGYIMAGVTYSFGAGGSDAWLIKTDGNGIKVWDKTFGGSVTDQATEFGSGSLDAWMIKTDESGNKVWDKTFGGSDHDQVTAVQQTKDGGYVLAGYTRSFGAGIDDAWLIKTDENGNLVWDKTFGGVNDDGAFAVQQTTDNGYILAGYTATGVGVCDAWLIKTDADGNKVWDNTYGGVNNDVSRMVQQTGDGGFILAGSTDSYGAGGYDAWLIKTDGNGNKVWDRTFGGSNDDHSIAVKLSNDGGYVQAGWTRSPEVNGDAWVIKTDGNGNKVWERSFGGSNSESFSGVQQTIDNGYILTGSTLSFGAGNVDAWLIKTDANGNAPTTPTP